jgi:hypothetical protein
MRVAADLEDGSEKHVAMENRLWPMRELLGDMLLAANKPALALKEYNFHCNRHGTGTAAFTVPRRRPSFPVIERRHDPITTSCWRSVESPTLSVQSWWKQESTWPRSKDSRRSRLLPGAASAQGLGMSAMRRGFQTSLGQLLAACRPMRSTPGIGPVPVLGDRRLSGSKKIKTFPHKSRMQSRWDRLAKHDATLSALDARSPVHPHSGHRFGRLGYGRYASRFRPGHRLRVDPMLCAVSRPD